MQSLNSQVQAEILCLAEIKGVKMFEIQKGKINNFKIVPVRLSKEKHQRIKTLAKENQATITDILIQMIDYCLTELNESSKK